MAYTQLVSALIVTALCVILTNWTSSTEVCKDGNFFEKIQGRCSPCKGICQSYDKTLHGDCQCTCFPDSRECKRSPQLIPSGLATKNDTSSHEKWLIALTVFVAANTIGFVSFLIWYMCIERKYIMNNKKEEEKTHFHRIEERIPLVDNDGKEETRRDGQPDKIDNGENTALKEVVEEPKPDPPTDGEAGLQEEGMNSPEQGLAGDVTFDHRNRDDHRVIVESAKVV